VLDERFTYGYEFYGVDQHAVITPLTERCFLSMWQACRINKGSLICGRSNTGKTQTAKVLTFHLTVFNSIEKLILI
jgi:dynein heavy chain